MNTERVVWIWPSSFRTVIGITEMRGYEMVQHGGGVAVDDGDRHCEVVVVQDPTALHVDSCTAECSTAGIFYFLKL